MHLEASGRFAKNLDFVLIFELVYDGFRRSSTKKKIHGTIVNPLEILTETIRQIFEQFFFWPSGLAG